MTFYGSSRTGSIWFPGLKLSPQGAKLHREYLKEVGAEPAKEDAPVALDMAEIAKRDGVVTRKQVAEYFGVDVKTIQRMEAKGILKRCPGLLGAVRYRARDVLRLASAPGKER